MPLPEHHPILILGAGLAGLSAAVTLAEEGVPCTILETRKHLGGRAASTIDPRSGEEIDNCQHVALGCCTQYLHFLDRIGSLHHLQWTTDQHWIHVSDTQGPGQHSVTRITNSPLLPPLHGLPSLLGARFLSLPAKFAAIHLASRGLLADRHSVAHLSFTQWLAEAGVDSDELVQRLLTPIIVSACNCLPSECSAEAALHVLQDAIFSRPAASAIGLSRVPLSALYEPIPLLLARVGSTLHTGISVHSFDARTVTISSGTSAGTRTQTLTTDRLICALPFERVATLASPSLARTDPRVPALSRLKHSPILGVHLKFAEPVCPYPHAVLVDRPTQWVFRKDDAGRHLHCVISAADEWMDLSESEIIQRVCVDLSACFATTPQPTLTPTWARAIKERRATFVPSPESCGQRPTIAAPAPGGVLLAGDYTRTGWPATMESAARSGAMAAALALDQPGDAFLAPALPKPALLSFLPSPARIT
jgi:zeta-carotene desaturase